MLKPLEIVLSSDETLDKELANLAGDTPYARILKAELDRRLLAAKSQTTIEGDIS